ncbi:hypothetical protein P692DRAFT_20107264, partial [Suillus brevipes Sb2]
HGSWPDEGVCDTAGRSGWGDRTRCRRREEVFLGNIFGGLALWSVLLLGHNITDHTPFVCPVDFAINLPVHSLIKHPGARLVILKGVSCWGPSDFMIRSH